LTENIRMSARFRLKTKRRYTITIVYNIKILKDRDYYVVVVHLANGSIREYRHQKFEDVITEAVTDLQ